MRAHRGEGALECFKCCSEKSSDQTVVACWCLVVFLCSLMSFMSRCLVNKFSVVESFCLYLFCPEFFFSMEKKNGASEATDMLLLFFFLACSSCVVSSLLFHVKSHCAMCLLQADHTVWTEDRMWNTYCLKSSVLKDRGSVFLCEFFLSSFRYLFVSWVIKVQWL